MGKTKDILKRLEESRLPEVGIFFKIDGRIWGWGEPVRDIEPMNGVVDIDYLHSDYFDDLTSIKEIPITINDDYCWYPRGRVIFIVKDGTYHVIMDKCLNNAEDKFRIADEFNLPLSKIVWEYDEHYCCVDCSNELKRQMKIFKNRRK